MNNIIAAFVLTFIAGISTLIGSIFIFYKGESEKLIKYALAFAAGIMISVSFADLLPEGLKLLLATNSKNSVFGLMILFILLGMAISFIIDKVIPGPNDKIKDKKLYKVGIFLVIAIIIHNIPEGIATFLSSTTNITLGISLTVAIALHNVPEGVSVAVPIYHATKSRKKAIWYTFISGMSEPLGALLAFIFLKPFITDLIMGFMLAIVTGIMLYISLMQLLPTALEYKGKKKTIIFFIIGFLFMLFSHLLLS